MLPCRTAQDPAGGGTRREKDPGQEEAQLCHGGCLQAPRLRQGNFRAGSPHPRSRAHRPVPIVGGHRLCREAGGAELGFDRAVRRGLQLRFCHSEVGE